MFGTAAAVTPNLKSGRLRALAVTTEKPSALMPELPAIAATLPGYDSGTEAIGSTPEEFATAVKTEITCMGKVIREARAHEGRTT
jgi:Tripartite tricarboxylate transporter family receptor